MFAKDQLASPVPSSEDIDHGVALSKSGDFVGALKLLWPAAEQGDAKAQNTLGVLYARGRGVHQDAVAAVSWYRKAAEQGDSVAQYNLAYSYTHGFGVTKNEDEALAWYLRSAAQGNHM